jgi:putative ABC transport system permease protein
MWRATWKGLVGHKLRLILTALAIVLGTGFVAGSYVFTDTLDGAFTDLFSSAFAGTDVIVRPDVDEDLTFVFGERMDAALADEIEALDGVETAEGSVGGLLLLSIDGEPVSNSGPPILGSAWIESANPFEIREGREPRAPGELVIDKSSADRFGIAVGDTVQVTGLLAPTDMTVVGLVGLGSSDGFGGATALAFERSQAEQLFDASGQVDAINVVAEDGVSPAELIGRITPILPPKVEAIDSRTAIEEQLSGFKAALGFINTFLLVFGFVSLFVGSFIIQNTFRIIIAQRGRELAMLRAIGATRGQIMRMVLSEAMIVSVVASLFGVVTGIGLAYAIKAVFEAFGGSLPDSDLVVRPRTLLVALVAGFTVTVISAMLPAFAASRIPPVAAMRELASIPQKRSLRTRSIIGSAVTVIGLGLLWWGLTGETPDSLSPAAVVGVGAGAIFIGVAILTPLMVKPVGRTIGRPLSASGTVGRLAVENAVRSPRRTAATSAAIMIGTALAGLALILGSSLSATTDSLIADRFRSDLIVQPAGFGGAELSPELATRLAELPEVEELVAIRRNAAKIGDDRIFLGSADLDALSRLVLIESVEGELGEVTDDQVAISQDTATEKGLAVGDDIEMTFARTGDQAFTVGAIFTQDGPGAEAYITNGAWEANFAERFDSSIFVKLAPSVDLEAGRQALTAITESYPGADVLDQNQFAEEAKEQINQFVGLVFALLGLTLLIGFFGILNTLLLSIIERTREIGLLRAVGTTRSQLSNMVTWEAVIVAVFGSVLGIILGIFFGWALISALQRDSELVLAIPAGPLALSVVVAAVAGVIAAVYPAWRASRLNVLAAIAYE